MQLTLLIAILVPFVELAARATADPIVPRDPLVRLPIKKIIDPAQPGSLKPAQRDLIRSIDGIANVPLTKNLSALAIYTATVGVGHPPTFYESQNDLIVDTGSSNTWVGANKPYIVTNTSVKTSDGVNVTYDGSAFVIGTEYYDSVTIASGVVILSQSIGVASNSSGIFPLDGVLGVGPDHLTLGKLIPNNSNVIPTVTDNLFDQGQIGQKLIAVSFEPTTSALAINGELTFGSTDSTKFIGDINYVPITDTFPSSDHWGIDASLQYGNGSITTILDSAAGIVDTGTALLGLAPDAYNLYLHATGGIVDNSTGLIRITPAQYDNLESLFFEIGGTRYELIPNAQIWPRSLNSLLGGQENFAYLVVYNIGIPPSGTLDFIMGMAVLERLYSVLDSANQRVGFATTQFTNATIN